MFKENSVINVEVALIYSCLSTFLFAVSDAFNIVFTQAVRKDKDAPINDKRCIYLL